MRQRGSTLAPRLSAPRNERLPGDVLFALAAGAAFDLLTLYIENPYVVLVVGCVLAFAAALFWAKSVLPWVAFVSVMAANPAFNVSVSLNLLCGIVFVVLNWNRLGTVPRWAVVLFAVAATSVVASAPAWRGGFTVDTGISQGTALTNYLIGPFLVLPTLYFRLRNEQNSARLVSLFLYALVVPTVVILALAHAFGRPVSTMGDLSLRGYGISQSILRLANIDVVMTRTQVGFALAALICASFAIVVSPVARLTRVVAGVCFLIGLRLMTVTASVGSAIAGLVGVIGILVLARRHFSISRTATGIAIGAAVVFFVWFLAPAIVQNYVMTRYDARFGKGFVESTDRVRIWTVAAEFLVQNPAGIGWSLWVEPIREYPHNDYLTYGIAYGIVCGLVYLVLPLKLLYDLVKRGLRERDVGRIVIGLVGVGVAVVLLVNSFSDHLTANRWYFNLLWSMVWYSYCGSRVGVQHDSGRQVSPVRRSRLIWGKPDSLTSAS